MFGDVEIVEEISSSPELTFEKASVDANSEIESFVRDLDACEMQDLVAALLHGMGYYTPFIAPKGRDGGVDIQAYRDPLGTVPPRIIVQVKHRIDKVPALLVRGLSGLLRREGNSGLFVSTGGFTSDALSEAKNSLKHIETIGMKRSIDLWKSYYLDMPEKDKLRLPLREILFLAPAN